MIRIIAAILAASVVAFATVPAQAKHYRHHATHHSRSHVKTVEHAFFSNVAVNSTAESDQRYAAPSYSVSLTSQRARKSSYEGGGVVGGRPAGCPHAFCGCEASRYVFGRIIPELNLAYNWIRKFPRTSPAPGMAAARNHHVMILIQQVDGSDWLVHDGNSGGHLTRDHVRPINADIIVNPQGSRVAMK